MQDVTEHPYGQQCITALFAAFDPECEHIGLTTLPWSENEEIAIWYFTADINGDETEAGTAIASGFVTVQKAMPVVAIWTLFPMQSFTLFRLFDEPIETI